MLGLCIVPAAVWAQFNFTVAGRPVQIHSFGSGGFAYSNVNNYLTMKTSAGSFNMGDFGANISMVLSDKLRIGAQIYDRNIGELGAWHPQLDWAVADYKFRDWLGFRAGVVKTVFGLYTDSQDVSAVHTFALLPQSVYPTDLRDALLRHKGADVYGQIPLRRAGSLEYTVFAGWRADGRYGGYPYLLSGTGGHLTSYGGLQAGADLRWSTPVRGLLAGASHLGADVHGVGTWSFDIPGFPPVIPYSEHSRRDWTNQFYGQYTNGNLRVDAEYRRYWRDQSIFDDMWEITTDVRGWYIAGAYRISRHLELGGYYSRWMLSWVDTMPGMVQAPSQDSPDRHLYDKVVTARIDVCRYWNFKLEGHFIDGYGGVWAYPSGFYQANNPGGLKPKTNLLVLQTGWSF